MNNYDNPDNVDVLRAETAIIDNAQITTEVAKKPRFEVLVLMFLVGALSFAVALSYNNFAQALIARYSLGGDGITATFINLLVFTAIALGLLYVAWRTNPKIVGSAIA